MNQKSIPHAAALLFLIPLYVQPLTFSVNDHGASSSSSNCREAIMKAIAAARASGAPAEVVFGEGRYRVSTDDTSSDPNLLPHCISVSGANEITFRGVPGKTTIIVTNPKNGLFRLQSCKRISFRDLTVDYDPLPFTQGRIVSINTNDMSYEVRLDAGYDALDRPYFLKRLSPMAVYDPETCPDLVPGEAVIPSSNQQLIDGGSWRLYSKGPWQRQYDPKFVGPDPLTSPYVRCGAKIVFSARDGGNAFTFGDCTDISISNVHVFTAPGFMVLSMMGKDLAISDCRIGPPERSGRFRSTCADGLHIKNLRGKLTIERSRLEKMGDDSINFHVTGLFVEKVISESEFLLNGRGWSGLVLAGDTIQIIDQKNGLRSEAVVTSLTLLDKGRKYQVTLDRPVPAVISGDEKTADLVFSVTGSPNPFTVRDNYLASETEILARGVNGIIENNTFVSTTIKQALVLTYSAAPWYEGPMPQHIRIQSNNFMGQRVSQIVLGGARDIDVTGNRFKDIASTAVQVKDAQNIIIKNNRIMSSPGVVRTNGYSYITIDRSEGVIIDALDADDASELLQSVIKIGKSVKAGNAGATVRNVSAKIAPGVKTTMDERE